MGFKAPPRTLSPVRGGIRPVQAAGQSSSMVEKTPDVARRGLALLLWRAPQTEFFNELLTHDTSGLPGTIR